MDIYNIYEKKILEVLKSKTAKHEEEMMKSNFVQLSWNDTSKKVLEAGTYIVPFADGVKYRLLDDYEPKQKTEASFEYAPEFQHPIMMLGKIPFILTTGDTTSFQTADKETDWVYIGVASTIIQKIVDYINIIGAEIPDIGTGWFAVIDADIIGSKTCTFSAMDVLSAISECCNQWSCEYYLHYETKALYFGKVGIGDAVTLKVGENIGIPSVSESKEGYYNAFLVKGSTRNISQRSASGENTSVNKRLTLDPVKYPYGYIDKRENTAEPLMVKELIFEEVYPKLDLYVYNPRCRTRYLKDDDGNTVPGIDGKPKKYAVWYIRLAYMQNGVWMDYKITDDVVLSNKYQADNVGYYYNRYGNADHLTYKYAVFTNADFDAKWFTNKVTCQTSYSQYYVTVKAGDIVETAIAINNNGTLVLLIGESYTNYNSARNDSRGKAFRLAAQKDGIILQKYITEANIPSDYRHSQILDGMELSMSFQANENENALPSPLAGREFKLRYHKDAKTIRQNDSDGDSGVNIIAGDFEIVFDEGDIIIPTTIEGELYPRGERIPSLTGNKAILFNLAMDDRYKAQAYLDLEETANKEIERLRSDLNNYTFPSNPVVFEKELTNPHLHIGKKVRYDDGQGYVLETRVLKLVTNLDFAFKQSITVGNEQIKGTMTELREQIQQISTGGGGTGSGGGVNISDLKNLLMYYGRNYFLSKQNDDETPYNLSVGKTLNVGENINVSKDLNVGGNTKVDGDVDIDGFLKVLAAYINKMQSSNYTGDGLNDTGFKITNDKDGHSYLVVDELLVRMKAVFNELEVRKMTYSGGNVVYSGAGSKIFRVEYLKKATPDADNGEVLGYTVVKVPWLLYGSPLAIENYVLGSRKKVRTEVNMAEVTHFRCYLIADDGTMATTNWWERYDQARCQTFNLSKNGRNAANGTDSVNTYGINESNLQNNFYWRLVSHVGQQRLEDDKVYNYVDLSKTDCLAGSGIPVAGDSIVQFGNRSKVERQNVITLEVIGEDAPAIKEYMGINSYDLTNKRRTMISPKSGDEFYATRFVIVTSYGAQYPIPVDRGLWLNIPLDVKGHRRCYYYDRVSHNGSTWLCMVADGWHYEDANGNVVSSDTEGAIRTRNYTTDEPSLTSQDWQISVEKGERGYATFKSLVFKRAASKPAKPAANEGSFQSPVPSGWSDGIPAGNDTIWMTSRIFTSDGGGIQEAAWTNVELMSDTETFDVEFAKLQPNRAKPAEPDYTTNAIKNDTSANKVWYDPSEIDDVNVKSEDMVWMATRTKDNGVWGSWTIAKIKGEDGGFKSSVFARTNTRPATPAGGTYTSPYPTNPANVWHDGIPNGEAQIWMSVCTFWPDGSSTGWSTPQPQSDTDTLDIEFSPSATRPAAPTGNTPFANHEAEGWYDPSSANFATAGQMIWRAERKVSNGEFDGDWVITRIYGEKGDQGIRGDFKSRVFLRQNTQPATPSGGTYDSPIPQGWYDGIPSGDAIIWSSVCTFYGAGGSSGWSVPAPESDTDTLDIEFSPSATEPSAPSGNTPFANHEAEGWYDPSSANFATAGTMIWRGERKVSNGVYDGSWVITRIYGEKGDTGLRGNFKSTVFKRTNTAPATPSGGTYDSPVPSGWSDGIPEGTAQIWASCCTFYGNGGSSGWSTPQPQSDTDTLDIEFSPSATEPSAPSGNTPFANHEAEGWYDPSSANFATAGTMIWRGERKVSNGVYDGSWVITRIYGEKGNPGNNAKGTKMRFTAAMTASATAPTLATVNNFTWYDTAASPTESYPCVYCSVWEINSDGSLVQCLSVSLFNRYGKTGSNGSDAYSFQLSAPSVIIGQATTSPYSMLIDGTPTGNTATTIIVRKGNRACTVNISSLTTHHCNASRTYGGTTYSNIFWITAVLTDSNSNYYETGYVEVTFTVTDPDNSNNTFSTTLRFNFYCNLMGTWKTTIEGDVERSVATKIEYLYSDENPNKVVKNADYVRSSSEMSSTIKRTLERLGANLLPLDKWKASSKGTDPDYIQDTNLLISNQVWLNHGVTYCFSFYAPKNTYTDNNYIDIIGMQDKISDPNNYVGYQYMWEAMSEVTVDTSRPLMGNSQMVLHYFTFSPYHEDKYIILRFYDYYRLYQPKLEIGTVPSDYDAEYMKMTSESVVRQLADSIYLGIVNALGETGIYIDGGNRHIDLTAALVTISESLIAKTLITESDNAQVSIQEGFMEFKSKLNQTKILFGIDDEGNAVLNYYGSNGNFLYGLGPNKIFETKSQAESMTLTYYDVDEGSNYASSILDSVIVQLYLYMFKNETPSSLTSLYKYLAKITAGQYGPGIYCASSADAASYNGKIIRNGYSSTNKLQSSDVYNGGIVVTSGRTTGGIIKYLSSIRDDLSNIEYEGWDLMQDSDFNRTLQDGCYYFNTKDAYSPVQAFYWDRYNGGAIGYGNNYYYQWQNLNVCTNPDDDDTLIDPIYYFALTEVNANGGIEGVRYLYINKSKLSRILQQYNKRL